MKLVVGNWKMRVGVRESVALARGTLLALRGRKVIPDVVVCPPVAALSEVRKVVARSSVALGAQNCSWLEQGALTGETSIRILQEIGASYVIIGHSERRRELNETDEMVRQKMQAVLQANITPILSVGETRDEHSGGNAREAVRRQVMAALEGVSVGSRTIVIAYEPIWAVGTGERASVSYVKQMHEFIREVAEQQLSGIDQSQLRVLYGGSITGETAYSFLREDEIDGVLVGGASVKINEFAEVIGAAAQIVEGKTEQ